MKEDDELDESREHLYMLIESLRHAAEHDELTDLYNLKKFCVVTRDLIDAAPALRYVTVRWDIERLKIVNDLFGREEGDKLLLYIADILVNMFYEKMGTYARVEGDDFVLCYPYVEETYLVPVTQITAALSAYPLDLDISPCFGFYVLSSSDLAIDSAVDRANIALSYAKRGSACQYAFYDGKMRAAIVREQRTLAALTPALEKGQFGIFLQPKFSLKNTQIVGAEALVRWFHPTRGVIGPDEFIPLFERDGRVSKLDECVWRQVCEVIARWRDEGKPLVPVSVNMSRVNVYRANLVEDLLALIAEYDIDPGLFELEITETAYIENHTQLLAVMRQLQACGFKISMDDFGSGYSSLCMLKDIPVDALKIDLSFLEGFFEGGRGSIILDSVVRMAKYLEIPVIAEGVETREQAEFLIGISCESAQGYYYARPMPVEDFELLLTA